MNHDAAHCWDCAPDCPKTCYREQLTREYRERMPGFPVSWMMFKGTDDCPLKGSADDG